MSRAQDVCDALANGLDLSMIEFERRGLTVIGSHTNGRELLSVICASAAEAEALSVAMAYQATHERTR